VASMIVYEERPFFRDRADAGNRLAERLTSYQGGDVVVLAIPRGGVPVAVRVADRLGAPLDVVVPRKIQIPYNPEAGYGAVTEDGTIILNEPLVARLGLTEEQIQRQAEEVRQEVARRSAIYRSKFAVPSVERKTAIIIDDGLASGFTMAAAIKSTRQRRAAHIVVAVPVASAAAYELVEALADEVISLIIAHTYGFAVASYYYQWYDLTDQEVIQYLEDWQTRHSERETAGL
jgi:putative phosphoribosyl transferase